VFRVVDESTDVDRQQLTGVWFSARFDQRQPFDPHEPAFAGRHEAGRRAVTMTEQFIADPHGDQRFRACASGRLQRYPVIDTKRTQRVSGRIPARSSSAPTRTPLQRWVV